jgi:hypothetical protein
MAAVAAKAAPSLLRFLSGMIARGAASGAANAAVSHALDLRGPTDPTSGQDICGLTQEEQCKANDAAIELAIKELDKQHQEQVRLLRNRKCYNKGKKVKKKTCCSNCSS